MRNKVLITLLGFSGLLGGCASMLNPAGSSDFDCPGMPKGIVCKNPREVYDKTNGDLDTENVHYNSPNEPKVQNPASQTTASIAYQPSGNDLTQPEPLVTQTRVLRVWVAPWVDKNKDLHWPGLMFTKIQTSQWNYGEEAFDGVEPPIPHQIQPSTPDVTMPATAPQAQTNGPAGTNSPAGNAAVTPEPVVPPLQ